MQRQNGEGGRKKLIKCDIYQIGTQHGGQTCKLQGGTIGGGGRGMVPKRAACCMRGKLAIKFRFILPKRALKMVKLQLATACVASSIYFSYFSFFFCIFWLGFASRQVALRAQAAPLLRHFACVALGLGDLLVGMWRSEHASHS